jgi:peptidoglycan/xylan/chitin deacetylase (PgdA/CDA1 family)
LNRPPPRRRAEEVEAARLAALRRRRRARRQAERRRRAALRRRRVLIGLALAAAVTGAIAGGKANDPGPPGSPEPVLVHSHKPVPILMYHVIASAPAGAANPQLFTKPIRFQAQMRYLASHGYTAVTMQRVYDAWEHDGLIPAKPVVVSFDDGYRGDYTDAMPILREHGWPGNLNLELGAVEDGELTDGMIRAMLDAGWELDSHTITHRDLTQLESADLRREIGGSREIIHKRFGVPVNFFCYPAGRFDRPAVREVRRAGYLGATTTMPGLASRQDLFKLRRIRIDESDGVRALARKLRWGP